LTQDLGSALPEDLAVISNTIWIPKRVYQLEQRNPADGSFKNTIPSAPGDTIFFAAGKVWVADYNTGNPEAATIAEIVNNTSQTIINLIPFTSTNPNGSSFTNFDLAYDGSLIWITDTDPIATVNPVTKAITGPLRLPGNVRAKSDKAISTIFVDGHIWMAADDKLFKFQPPTTTPESFTIAGRRLFQLAYDGSSLWLSTYGTGEFIKVRPGDGAVLAVVATSYPANYLLIFGGDSLWAVPWANMGAGGFFEPAPILKIPVIFP